MYVHVNSLSITFFIARLLLSGILQSLVYPGDSMAPSESEICKQLATSKSKASVKEQLLVANDES